MKSLFCSIFLIGSVSLSVAAAGMDGKDEQLRELFGGFLKNSDLLEYNPINSSRGYLKNNKIKAGRISEIGQNLESLFDEIESEEKKCMKRAKSKKEFAYNRSIARDRKIIENQRKSKYLEDQERVLLLQYKVLKERNFSNEEKKAKLGLDKELAQLKDLKVGSGTPSLSEMKAREKKLDDAKSESRMATAFGKSNKVRLKREYDKLQKEFDEKQALVDTAGASKKVLELQRSESKKSYDKKVYIIKIAKKNLSELPARISDLRNELKVLKKEDSSSEFAYSGKKISSSLESELGNAADDILVVQGTKVYLGEEWTGASPSCKDYFKEIDLAFNEKVKAKKNKICDALGSLLTCRQAEAIKRVGALEQNKNRMIDTTSLPGVNDYNDDRSSGESTSR